MLRRVQSTTVLYNHVYGSGSDDSSFCCKLGAPQALRPAALDEPSYSGPCRGRGVSEGFPLAGGSVSTADLGRFDIGLNTRATQGSPTAEIA